MFTPGPWAKSGPARIISPTGQTVAYGCNPDDADLLAQAPAMYTALQDCLVCWGDDGCTCGDCWTCKARAAITGL